MKKILFCGLVITLGCLVSCNGGNQNKSENNQQEKEMIDNNPENESIETKESNLYKIEHNLLIPEGIPMVVDFYADWCGPCKQYSPVFHTVAEKYAGQAIFLSINVDENPELAKSYDVNSIPKTVFILPGGGLYGAQTGVIEESALEAYINQLLADNAGDDLSI